MEKLPPEVLRDICTYLNFQDAANVRFLTRTLSDVAAEFLITRVRFHTSGPSLERLKSISQHPIFSQTVKVLAYEATLLADVKTRHEYAKHFELEHHGLDRPREPPPGCSERERRLHLRNKQKWRQDIYTKYEVYRQLFDAQKSLLDNDVLANTLSQCIPRFTKLSFLDVDPIQRCSHVTSKRFIEEFGSDCGSPLSANFGKVSEQFKYMLLPNNSVIHSLRKLEITALSPNFFKSTQRDSLTAAFRHLIDIDIVLRLADKDLQSGESYKDCFRRHLSNGVLRDAFAAAADLENISVGIECALLIFVEISDIFPETIWNRLKSIGLSTLSTTQDEMMQFLKRQPSLKNLGLTLMQLTQGTWVQILEEMRNDLDLDNFMPSGFLEDPQESWPMDLINMSVYEDSFEEYDLGSAIGMYVTKEDPGFDEEGLKNPLVAGFDKYDEPDMVREIYGTLSDLSDSDSSERYYGLYDDIDIFDGMLSDDGTDPFGSDFGEPMSDVELA